ncbi:hypothetical protein BN1708_002842 [Verticillium longisporum]|uniref:Major facilitator superfamily (MFS) profile domain-containing protein n=1 Tax=Verticillium longisporum TaxID=100787 RepID=A0A0G4L3R4_VERLO|nr:hypothetical protein BN1708_002842 [Verticillium longisporum]
MGVKEFFKRRSLRAKNDVRTNAAEMTLRESLFPIVLVTTLFFLWGFSYSLLDILNKHFQNVLHINRARSAGLQAAYFGAYPLASLGHAAWILRHWGYKATFVWGLFLYGLGSIIAIPCIINESFGGFCAAIFIIGNGLGSLETAANPYIAVCGPPRYSEVRLNVSQAFNGIGTVVSPLIGARVFFGFDDDRALENVQWVYLAIAAFVWDVRETGAASTDSRASNLFAGAQGTFAAGRFIGAGIMHFVKPRKVFLVFLSCCSIFLIPAAIKTGTPGMAMLYLVLFFESICFPTIVALGMRGLGRHSKRGSGFIVAGVSGGACVPPLMGAVADMHGKGGNNMGVAMTVPLAFMVAATSYAVAVNFVPRYRDVADAFTATEVGVHNTSVDEEKVRAQSIEETQMRNAAPTLS